MARWGNAFAALAVAAGLAGCSVDGSQWLYGGAYEDVGTSSFRYAGAGRDFRTEVVGNPFDTPDGVTRDAVLALMQGRDKGMGTRFTADAGPDELKPFRIVMLFNPEPRHDRGAVCTRPLAAPDPGRGPRLTLVAAFCHAQELMFAVASSMPAVSSPYDPAFARMVDRLMYAFVPYESMTDDPDDD
jgi:hypothetical protein